MKSMISSLVAAIAVAAPLVACGATPDPQGGEPASTSQVDERISPEYLISKTPCAGANPCASNGASDGYYTCKSYSSECGTSYTCVDEDGNIAPCSTYPNQSNPPSGN